MQPHEDLQLLFNCVSLCKSKCVKIFTESPILHVLHSLMIIATVILISTYIQDHPENWFVGLLILPPLLFWINLISDIDVAEDIREFPPVVQKPQRQGGWKQKLLIRKKYQIRYPKKKQEFAIIFGDKHQDFVPSKNPEWLNIIISRLWKNLKPAMEDLGMNIIWPKIYKLIKKSSTFIYVHLYSFSLGMVAPRIEQIQIKDFDEEDKIVFDISLVWASEASAEIRLLTAAGIYPIKAKIDNLLGKIKVRVAITGLMKEKPFFKAIELQLDDYPTVFWRTTGTGEGNAHIIEKIVKKKIIKRYLEPVVWPGKVTIPVISIMPSKLIDEKHTFQEFFETMIPHPTGILSVMVKGGRNLMEADYTTSLTNTKAFFKSPIVWIKQIPPKKRKSDPYLLVKVGSAWKESKVCNKSQKPEFDFECHIPVENPQGHKISIDVYDYDKLKECDFLGRREESLNNLADLTKDPLTWRGLVGVTQGELQTEYKWQPVHELQTQQLFSKGVISFAFKSITIFGDVGKNRPRVEIRLLQNNQTDQEDDIVKPNLGHWKHMKPIKKKEGSCLALGHLKKEANMDGSMFHGGMLNFDESHEEVEIEVYLKTRKSFHYEVKSWSHKLPIEDVVKMSLSEENSTIVLKQDERQKKYFFKASYKYATAALDGMVDADIGIDGIIRKSGIWDKFVKKIEDKDDECDLAKSEEIPVEIEMKFKTFVAHALC